MLKDKVLKELKNFWNDEEAQGMMEYILLAVLVIGAVTIAKDPILNAIQGKANSMGEEMGAFSGNIGQ